MNIFEILPQNFFNIFNTSNRQILSECLYTIYHSLKDNVTYSMLKENMILELTHYFNTHIVEFNDIQSDSSKDKAYYIYRRLKECGWIHEELGENYQTYVSLEEYTIPILETLFNLNQEKDIEYSSMIYTIYSAFNSFDMKNGHKTLDAQYHMTQELMNKLKNLNTNIKIYIKRLLKDNMKNNLKDLLDSLLSEYQLKIVDRAFYNLTTRDNPALYRNKIIERVNDIRENQRIIDHVVRNIMATKDLTYEEALTLFDDQTLYIIESFEEIENVINDIHKKNEQFVSFATNRIMFLINVKEDIGGKINTIIKGIQEYPEVLEQFIDLSENKVLDYDSLYSPRMKSKTVESVLLEQSTLDENIKKEVLLRMQYNKKYTKTNIQISILNQLKEQKQILGSSLLKQNQDISLFVLSWLYGYGKDSKYMIEPLDYIVSVEGYSFKEFMIKEKIHE